MCANSGVLFHTKSRNRSCIQSNNLDLNDLPQCSTLPHGGSPTEAVHTPLFDLQKCRGNNTACAQIAVVGDNLRIQQHVPLKGIRNTSLSPPFVYSQHSPKNEPFSTWQRVPNNIAVCNTGRNRLLATLFLLFTQLALCRKVAPVTAFAHASFCMIM